MSQTSVYFPNIKIVLVATTHPGNIGSAARAMKAMGFSRLVLVSPYHFPHAEATSLASGADDLLANAEVVATLEEAIADCRLVVGTSARVRTLPWPMLTTTQTADQLLAEAQHGDVALVFGQEKSGLTNEQLQLCHAHVSIDTNDEFAVLNLSQAVQVMVYQIRSRARDVQPDNSPESDYATSAETQRMYAHLETALTDIGFINPNKSTQVIPRLRRLFARARLETTEVKILRGILSFIQKATHAKS